MHADIVSQGRLQPLEDQVYGVGVNPHVGLAHRFGNGCVNAARLDVAISKLVHAPPGNGGLEPAAGLAGKLGEVAYRNLQNLF